MSDEAREAAESAFPESEWTQRATILAFRDAFEKGAAWGVAKGRRRAREAVAAAPFALGASTVAVALAAIDALGEADHDARTDQPWDLGGDHE